MFNEISKGNLDLSVCQRKKLNNLKAIRKELNDELNHLPHEVNYYYGIRNNKITKLKINH